MSIKCTFCGHEFTEDQGINACKGCPVSNCSMIKCPNCGYEILSEPKSLEFFKRLFKKGSQNADN